MEAGCPGSILVIVDYSKFLLKLHFFRQHSCWTSGFSLYLSQLIVAERTFILFLLLSCS